MPVKNMIMDALSYTDQIRELWEDISDDEKKKLIGSDDYFSQFSKKDKLHPIITLVFYWGEDWDGNMNLYDMFDLADVENDEKIMNTLRKYVSNYHINLVQPARIDELSVFKTDLQNIFGVLKFKDSKEKFNQYIDDNEDYFGCMDYDSCNALEEMLGAKGIFRKKYGKKKEGNDMCKALKDLYNDGVEQGRFEALSIFITTLRELNHSEEQIIEQLIKKYNLTPEEANKRMKECA